MAQINSDCGAARSPRAKTALITSGCVCALQERETGPAQQLMQGAQLQVPPGTCLGPGGVSVLRSNALAPPGP